MDINVIQQLITSLGFPIVCVLALGWFVYQNSKNQREDNKAQMEAMAERCQKREDKLYEQIDKFNVVLNSFNETLIRIDARLEALERKM